MMRYNKLDSEIGVARSEMDPGKRLKMYHEIQKKLMEDLPAIPVHMTFHLTPYRAHLAGIPEIETSWAFDFYPIHFVEKKWEP